MEEDDFDLTLKELASQSEINDKKLDEDLDCALALVLQSIEDAESNNGWKENKASNNAVCHKMQVPQQKLSSPLSIVSEQWETIDPNPNIQSLFIEFNAAYFWGALECVEVRWSPRMTLCAGVCSYEGRGGLCSIRLSQPLLKFRPRRDLVETLLHEMIHAYLFVTDNNKDHGAHGPKFLKHMYRINKQTGSRITVYHSFHDEVDHQRQHWWKCNGPCQKRPPYFGIVKRAMNRAPSRNDPWWSAHQAQCGGVYVKIRSPESTKLVNEMKNSQKKNKPDSNKSPLSQDIQSYFKPSTSKKQTSATAMQSNSTKIGTLTVSPSTFKTEDNSKKSNSYSITADEHRNFVPFSGKGYKMSDDNGSSKKRKIHSEASPASLVKKAWEKKATKGSEMEACNSMLSRTALEFNPK